MALLPTVLGLKRIQGGDSRPRCRGCRGRDSAGSRWLVGVMAMFFTWRKARFDGAMVAFVNRQEDAQVRQVGASDPEQQHAFSKGGLIYVMVIRTGPSTSYDDDNDDYVDSPRLQ